MDLIRIFGTNLKKYRTELGLSQEHFAELCGLHRTYISSIEFYRRNISLDNIQRIAEALDKKPYELLLEEDDNNGKKNNL